MLLILATLEAVRRTPLLVSFPAIAGVLLLFVIKRKRARKKIAPQEARLSQALPAAILSGDGTQSGARMALVAR